MVDTDALRLAIREFEANSQPTSSSYNSPATVHDLKNLIRNLAKTLNQIVDAMDED